MARKSKPPIPPKMYRHFALVTVGVTGLLALIASGENDEASENLAQAEAAQSASGPSEEPKIIRRDKPRFGYADNEVASAAFGKPSNLPGAGNSSIFYRPNASDEILEGLDDEFVQSLTDEEKAYLKRILAEDGLTGDELQRLIDNLEESSRRRAGPSSEAA